MEYNESRETELPFNQLVNLFNDASWIPKAVVVVVV